MSDNPYDFAQSESEQIISNYQNGECPDCGLTIPIDVVCGQCCENCEHSFWLETEDY